MSRVKSRRLGLVLAIFAFAACALSGTASAQANGTAGSQAYHRHRNLLQTTAPSGGQCGASVNARCPSGQCCSQWGWCGVTSDHCNTGCQRSWGTCWGVTPSPSPAPRPSPPPAPRTSVIPSPSPSPRPSPPPVSAPGANGCPAGWTAAVGTLYDSWPKPGTVECVNYSGCRWAGRFAAPALWATGASTTQCKTGAVYMDYYNTEWACRWPESKVASWNLAATWDRDPALANKQIRVMRAGDTSRSVTVNVGDLCNDNDCGGCCSKNTGNGAWKMIDMEKGPASQLFGFSTTASNFDINSVSVPTVASTGIRRDGAPSYVIPMCYQVVGDMPRLV